MLKAILQTWHDDGVIVFGEKELHVTYAIEARGNANVREASGTVTGLSPGDSYELLVKQSDLKLRLATGQHVDIAFLGGMMGGPQKIIVNSPMPGLG